MRYPVGRAGKTLDPLWYNAQGFGVKTSYGYHEAHADYNLKTGGDSDLGQPLYAVADGKIVYYHDASHPTSGFGRHMVLEVKTSRGLRWYHYCHCQKITAQVKEVKEGDVIGYLGKSGTTLAHLHFAVFKVDPKNLYKGIDSIARTSKELYDNWEAFELLSTGSGNPPDMQEKKYTEEEMTVVRLERDNNWNLYQDEKKKNEQLQSELDGANEKASQRKKQYENAITSLAQKLTLPTTSDLSDITGAVERLLSLEDQLVSAQKDLEKEKQARSKDRDDFSRDIETLRAAIDKQQSENDRLLQRIDELESRIKAQEQTSEITNRFSRLVESLLTMFNKGTK